MNVVQHIIFDLDGTLADCAHRVPLLPDWDAFYSACAGDAPILPVIEIYNALAHAMQYRVHIWSGRRDREMEKTAAWMNRNRVRAPHSMKMRPDGDHRPDTELKAEWLDQADFRPIMVFEDRTSVVKMYRDRGIQVCQVAPGDF